MSCSHSENIKAVAVFNGKISGTVLFQEEIINSKRITKIEISIEGLTNGLHGIHIHEYGDLREGCKTCCSHYNPHNKHHGDFTSKERHVGDLGNIQIKNNKGKLILFDNLVKLRGKYSIIGRSVVIHEDEDDCGKGGLNQDGDIINPNIHEESLKTGNAGARIACAVIGYAS